PHTRLGILQKLVPDAFLSDNARTLHEGLDQHYPELMKIIGGTTAFYTAFPANGIPSQAVAIASHVAKEFNAGIGVAKTYDSNVLMNPEFQKIFDMLRPENVNMEQWVKLRDSVFNYNNGLGAPWYRNIAYRRYLRDGRNDEYALSQMKKALRIRPIPTYGGTVALTIALEMAVGEECILIMPRTFWGNVNLKISHNKSIKEVCDYIDIDGRINPEELTRALTSIKSRGHHKAAVYFNFPHNPTGVVPTREEAKAIVEIIQDVATSDFQVIIICDEPYYPFVRGEDAISVPFSYYMQPGFNRNIITFVAINGTKRDGMYGMRHSDLIILTPEEISDEGIRLMESNLLAGYMRGSFSFSCALNQYLLGRALTNDPLIALRKPANIVLNQRFFQEEDKLIAYVETSVKDTIEAISSIKELLRITGDAEKDSYGGFFVTYQLSDDLKAKGITAMDLHRAGLKCNCGIIATNGFIRISGLVSKENDPHFVANLQKTIELALKVKSREGFTESMF
ncbi:aminotransferase class I/II-fold pyridoxal phosphate-dependent enzyme, partial [Myxococcota bacterium]|nr:aminotransferase class I/II-fold pyridoxal phosphate-dependent enzyme [Myxococcota bacterium]MBU1536887.1 aminotransferase class I/II-fold pyridoxal phosphate-dependent enzyme [Myxococcota bacterium]